MQVVIEGYRMRFELCIEIEVPVSCFKKHFIKYLKTHLSDCTSLDSSLPTEVITFEAKYANSAIKNNFLVSDKSLHLQSFFFMVNHLFQKSRAD